MQLYSLFSFFGVVLVAASIHSGEAISCYVCSSDKDSKCNDPFSQGSGLSMTNCVTEQQKYNATSYTRCLKLTQTVNGNTRVIRGCGSGGSGGSTSGCASRKGTASFSYKYCYCLNDGCNDSTRLRQTTNIIAAGFITSVVLLALEQSSRRL